MAVLKQRPDEFAPSLHITAISALTEIRTPVLALKGLRPGPLDDEGKSLNSIIGPARGQPFGYNLICGAKMICPAANIYATARLLHWGKLYRPAV